MSKNQKYQNFCAIFFALVLWCMLTPAAAAEDVCVHVDGTAYPGELLVRQGTTYLPVRGFFEFLGGWSVDWDSAGGYAVAEKDGVRIAVSPAAQTAQMDGTVHPVPVLSDEGRIYVPLRTLAGLLGYGVGWESGCKTALIDTGGTTAPGQDASVLSSAYSEDDLYWLSRIIHAEAQGESLAGQIAVGNVILNRVASSEYPNTVYDVIFDRKNGVQFTPVINGAIYCTPSETSRTAAEQALKGVNTAGGALFFFNPSLTQGSWIAGNRTYFTTIGCHVFYL